jgi:hypothetical protein
VTPEQAAILELSRRLLLLDAIIKQLADANRFLMRDYSRRAE